MAIRDQQRSRKVYSFFRIAPAISSVTTAGSSDLLIFPTVGDLQAYDASALSSGIMAYVQSVRDYWVIEKTVNSGSTDSIETVDALGFVGVWHRMGLGGNYWKNQHSWYINSETGNDENLGSSDKPLRSLDELHRRLLGVQKIGNVYTINLMNVTSSITNTYGMNIELDGGTVLFTGTPSLAMRLGTISALSGDVDYSTGVSGSAPFIQVFSSATSSLASSSLVQDRNLLYASSSTSTPVIGWAIDGYNSLPASSSLVYMTATDLTSTTNKHLFSTALPVIDTPGVIARGYGDIIFKNCVVGVSTSSGIVIGTGDEPAGITFQLASLESRLPQLIGGNVYLDQARIRSTSGSIKINNTYLYGSSSVIVSPRKQVNIRNSHVELGSTVIANSDVTARNSRIVLSVPLASGCALLSSSIELQSDSMMDVRNLIMTGVLLDGGVDTTHVSITGKCCTIFYDESTPPKANKITINNGYTQQFNWSGMPYQEFISQTLVVSGSLKSIINPID